MVWINLLGGFWVSVRSQVIKESEWRLRKAAGLIKLLALAPEHCMHREQVMDLLWPGSESTTAASNLRYVLHNARQTLESTLASASGYLSRKGDQLALCPEQPLWVDAEAFEDAAGVAHRACDPSRYEVAVELYAGGSEDSLVGAWWRTWCRQPIPLRGDRVCRGTAHPAATGRPPTGGASG